MKQEPCILNSKLIISSHSNKKKFQFDNAISKSNFKIQTFSIIGGKVGETPLHIAARIEEVRGEKCTKMLLKSGADTNLAMQDGRTPVHISAESGNIAVLKLLLANGADPTRTDKVLTLGLFSC